MRLKSFRAEELKMHRYFWISPDSAINFFFQSLAIWVYLTQLSEVGSAQVTKVAPPAHAQLR